MTWLLFGLLLACTAIAVELTRKAREQGGVIKDVQGVWEFPVAILLPPLLRADRPHLRLALMQWRVRRAPALPAGFQRASISLSYCAASVTFHGLSGLIRRAPAGDARSRNGMDPAGDGQRPGEDRP